MSSPKTSTRTDADLIEELRTAMCEKDIRITAPILADGNLHRYHVEGDQQRVKNGWVVVHLDEYPCAVFGCNKRYGPSEHFHWSPKRKPRLTAIQQKALSEKMKLMLALKEEELAHRRQAAATAALTMMNDGIELTDDSHPYLIGKGVNPVSRMRIGPWKSVDEETGNSNLISENALLIPLCDTDQALHTVQGIFPDGTKRFLKGGKKEGHYFAIGQIQQEKLLICEGLATGISLHECTGHAVAVAFDAGNLTPVAVALRKKIPNTRLLVAADNDQWTTGPIPNPGVFYAKAAAAATSGVVAVPQFKNVDLKPTDFNDLHNLEGMNAVRLAIQEAFGDGREGLSEREASSDHAPSSATSSDGDVEIPSDTLRNEYFQVLGYNRGVYFIYNYDKRQVVEYKKSDFVDVGFIELAPVEFWEEYFPSGNGTINKKMVANYIIRVAHKRGIFNVQCVRGRGAWYDNGHVVFHQGEYLLLQGARLELRAMRSRYIYEAGAALLYTEDEELGDDEGRKILDLIEQWNWENAGDAALAAGWIALASFCGALTWRPHVWITGGSGTGKTTFMEKIVFRLLKGIAFFAVANSTEAGIRQELGHDARPVIFDEAEGGDDRSDNRIKEVISLMRQASSDTGAQIVKGTQGGRALRFSCRALFLMSSIRAPIIQQADLSRIRVLSLKAFENSAEQDDTNLRLIDAVVPDERVGARLFRRVLNNFSVIKENIATFIQVAAQSLARRRDADQLGTLVAGAWALTSRAIVTEEEAARFLAGFQWPEFRDEPLRSEGFAVLQTITRQRLRDSNNHEVVVAELIAIAAGIGVLDRSAEEADHLLQRHGLRVMLRESGTLLLVATNHDAVRALARGSGFESDLWRQLARIEGARMSKQGEKFEKERFAGNPCRYVELPIACALGEDWESAFAPADSAQAVGEQLFVNRHPRASRVQ